MSESTSTYPLFLRHLVRGYALIGGIGLIAAAIITVISVVARGVGADAISGDFELVELATGIAVFSFLPWGHMVGAHVQVDVLAARFGTRFYRALGVVSNALIAVVAVVILWRLYLGFAEKFPYGPEPLREILAMGAKPFFPETTYELQVPMWVPYGFCLVGAFLFVLVAIARLVADIKG
ncbi:TRAP transporter small permease [Falsihalocynthiibacter sp. SS001]|uniref:TRAP transporter small permease n=1 Tax=Falsihalocynthiibacter sp. SS001 TaxID=3349698 RepID=UPI0036D3A983